MSQTISDAILDLIRKTAQGQDQREQLQSLVNQAIPATEEQMQAFQEHAPNNPEFTAEMISDIEAGLRQLLDAFHDVADQSELAPGPKWSASADALQSAIKNIRDAQSAHHERIEDGETSHLFLNRLLIHLEAWQDGRAPGPMTSALVQAVPHFEQELRGFIEEFEDSAVQDRMLVHLELLMDTCHAVADAVQAGSASSAELTQWQSKIVQFSQDLDQTLAETVESHLAQGPTPFPVVNLVNAALDRFLGNLVSAAEFADTAVQCEEWIRSQLPPDTDASLTEAAEGLFAVLQDMKTAALADQTDELASLRESLFAAAENLAMFAAVLSPEEGVVNLVSTDGLSGGAEGSDGRPMPRLLSTLLQQADAYLSGSSNSDALEESIEALERLVASTQGQMGRSRDSREVKERTQHALELLGDASNQLWDFLEKPTGESLDGIEGLLIEASDAVSALTPNRR